MQNSEPKEIPSATCKAQLTKSAPAKSIFCGTGPGLSSTGERISLENNAFERLPIPQKTSLQKPFSALGSILTVSTIPEVSAAESWMKASFGNVKPPQIASHSAQGKETMNEIRNNASPVEIPVSQKWESTSTETDSVTPLSATITQTHQTLPRMSRDESASQRQQWARRSFSTKMSNSPASILVKKRASEAGSKRTSSISPVTSESFSSLGMSPAVSWLSSFTEQQAIISPAGDTNLLGIYSPGDVIGDYTLIREIGSGCFSRVYEASSIDPQNPLVAIKIIHSDSNLSFDKLALQKESYLWSKLSHPNLLRMYESFDTDDAVLVVTELAQGGHLLDYILKEGRPGLPESMALSLFKQLASAVHYLHLKAGIVHRDIKLENILLDHTKMNIKLSDFGLSESISDSFWDEFEASKNDRIPKSTNGPNSCHTRSMSVQVGTNSETIHIPLQDSKCFAPGSLHYCAPEILKQSKSSKLPSDIWSMGCVLHALLTGSLPFNDSYLPRLQMSIINGRWDPSRLEKAQISPTCINLLLGMLQLKTEDRYSISEVMNHPWLQS